MDAAGGERWAPGDSRGAADPVPVLVTGATGFVGQRLALALARSGFAVRALARRPAEADLLARNGVDVVPGDLSDVGSLERAAAGRWTVFHTAARVSDWGPREEFQRVNAEGTRNVVSACREAGVARLVHLSSLTVLGLPRDGRVVDETTPAARPFRGDFYTESKLAAETAVREAHGKGGLATTVVRPGAIWGPGDPNILPRIFRLLERGVMPLVDHGGNLLGLTHVDNLCLGLELAGSAPAAAGELYHVTDGEEITARAALAELAAAIGVAPPRLSLPYPVVLGLAAAVEAASRLLGRRDPPPLSRYGVRFVACHCRYDLGKARRELRYEPAVTFRGGVACLAADRGGQSPIPRPRGGS